MGRVAAEGWITTEVAKELFTKAGLDFAEMKAKAAKGAFPSRYGRFNSFCNDKEHH